MTVQGIGLGLIERIIHVPNLGGRWQLSNEQEPRLITVYAHEA